MSDTTGFFGMVRRSEMPNYKHIEFLQTESFDTAKNAVANINAYSRPDDWLVYAFANTRRECVNIATRTGITWTIYDESLTERQANEFRLKNKPGKIVEVQPFVAPTQLKPSGTALDTALYALCVASVVAALAVVVTFGAWLTALMIKDMLS